jgi:hypothetical protein
VRAQKLDVRLIRRIENIEAAVLGAVTSSRDFSLSSFGRRRTRLKKERGSAVFELETPLSDEAIKALDDAIAQPGRASTAAPSRLTSYAPRTRAHFTPQHWLLCHLGLY